MENIENIEQGARNIEQGTRNVEGERVLNKEQGMLREKEY